MNDADIAAKASALLDKIQQRFPQLAASQQPVLTPTVPSQPAASTQVTYDNLPIEPDGIWHDELVKLLAAEKTNQLHHNYVKQDQTRFKGTAVIQAFFGTDIARITATSRALQVMLQANPLPKHWVFVEAQRNKNQAVFAWLKSYGVKYIFRKYSEDSEGLLLKTALWNIGAANTTADKLLFVDSDVVFCNQAWLNSASTALDNFDVISPAGWCYYEASSTRKSLVESIGHKVHASGESIFKGHIGFSIGMTRDAYNTYGRFEAFNLHDDVWLWTRIFGTDLYPENLGWIPYKPTDDMRYGLPFSVGSTDECCCHLDHGDNIKYKLFGYVSYLATSKPFEDILYDKSDIETLPTWANTKLGKSVRLAFDKIRSAVNVSSDVKQQAQDILLEARKEVYGEIDEQHPLIIMTAYVPDFKHKTIESVFEHKERLEADCEQPFTYVCFTNEISIEDAMARGLDVIPFSSDKVKNNRKLWQNEMKRKDIKLPKNATVIFLQLDLLPNKLDLIRKHII